MSVFDRITKEMRSGMKLLTPFYKTEFTIESIDSEKLIFLCGPKKTAIPIPKEIWNDIPDFLERNGWVRVGVRRDVAESGTLQYYIDHHPERGTQHSADANYVASVLEYLKIAEVTHTRPSKIRLK